MTLPSGAVPPVRKLCLGVGGERICAGRLAGFRPAEPQDMSPRRLAAKVVIKRNDAMHLGAREIERLRHHGDGRFRDMAECPLQGVQNRQGGAFTPELFRDDLRRVFRVPWFVGG